MARGGEHQALSLVVGASKTCSISRDAWGGTKRKLGAIESQPHASLPGPDTCMPKRERHRCHLRGSSQWERLPRVGLQHSASSARNRGGKERLEAHQRKRNQFLPVPSIPPSPSIQQMCEKSKKRHGKGDLLLSISEGWIETIDMLAETFVQRPLPSPGQAHLLARVETCRTSIFNSGSTFSHLLVDATRQEHPNEKQQVPSACFCFSSIFHVCQKMDAQGTDHCRPAGSCHDFTTSPDRP